MSKVRRADDKTRQQEEAERFALHGGGTHTAFCLVNVPGHLSECGLHCVPQTLESSLAVRTSLFSVC